MGTRKILKESLQKKILREQNEALDKIIALVKTKDQDNVELALQMAEGQGLKDQLAYELAKLDKLGRSVGNIEKKKEKFIEHFNQYLDPESSYKIQRFVNMLTLYLEREKVYIQGSVIQSDEDFSKFLDVDYVTDLEITQSKLSEIPEIVYSMENLESIIINGDIDFDERIYEFPELNDLRIIDSNMREMPEGINRARNIETLYLQYCENMTSLPDGIKYLPYLSELVITGTPIDEYELEELEELDDPEIEIIQ